MTWEDRWYGPRRFRLADLLLAPASMLFAASVRLRNLFYDSGILPQHRVEGPRIICVGNLAVGGAGKTPAVIFLTQWALAADRRVAVLSRGYGRSRSDTIDFDSTSLPAVDISGDEPRLIALRCPGARVFVGADRLALARRAAASGAQLLIMDDGFQHRRLIREVNIAVVDNLPNRRALPWGPLREPISALHRADFVWCRDAAPPHVDPRAVVRARYVVRPEPALRDANVIALAGLARSQRFVQSLESLGAKVVARQLFADHHPFSPRELEHALALARSSSARIVTTEKDLQRLPAGFDATAIRLEVQIDSGLDRLAERLGLPIEHAPKVVVAPNAS